ncbi:MAG: response regulator [Alphaproteobacteria bacterium]|nr:response regulator [Alphaproteobacteria bacterium]
MPGVMEFIESYRSYFDAAQAVSAVISIIGWCLGGVLLWIAWRRNAVRSVTLGPFGFEIQDAVTATATAARDWQTKSPMQKIDMGRIKATVQRAFQPGVVEQMVGKSVLWVDDNPDNNKLAMRALSKLRLDLVQETSTEAGLAAMQRRHFDLVISDMGRAGNMQAGYELLQAIRAKGNPVPFFIFAGSDTAEFRQEAAARGAQLSTNDMLELIDNVIDQLGV